MINSITQNLSTWFSPETLQMTKGTYLVAGGLAMIHKSGVAPPLTSCLVGEMPQEKPQKDTLTEKGLRYGMAALGVAATAYGIYSFFNRPESAQTLPIPVPPINICDVEPSLCEGNLGIPRSVMPQLDGEIKENFLNTYPHSCVHLNATRLIPIQNEGNWDKIQGMIKATNSGVWDACASPIIITRNNHILDGHHRAFSCSIMGAKVNAFKLDDMLPYEALEAANNFKGVEHHSLSFFAK